jgi:hypothetical protein
MTRTGPAVRRRLAIASVLLVVAGCTGPTSPGAGASPSPSRAREAPALLGADPSAAAAAAVLVAGPDGVSVFTPDGGVRELVDGPVAIAVDDLRGGLLYQRARARLEPGAASGPTAVERIAKNGRAPAVLVTPAPGQSLALHDSVDLGGEVAVFYTRFDGGAGHEDTVHTLMRAGAATGRPSEVRRVGGFEESSEPVSVTASLLVLTYLENTTGAFEFLSPDGTPVDAARNPRPPGTNCDAPCPDLAELSPDASTLAYMERGPDPAGYMTIPEVVLMDMDSGRELRRLRLDRPHQGWWPSSLDLGAGVVVVNRVASGTEGEREFVEPWLIDLRGEDPVVWQAPQAGHARLVRREPSVQPR